MKQLIVLTIAVATASISFAQTAPPDATTGTGIATTGTGVATTGTGVATTGTGVATTGTALQPLQVNDEVQFSAAEFMEKAAAGGLYEVQSSQLATTASQNNEVRQFAQRMITDHTAANQELKQLAASKNLQVPATLDDKHQKMMQDLQNKTGDDFDNTFGQQQAKAHQEAVTLFQKAANQSQDPELQKFAQQALPILQQHAQMANRLPGTEKANLDPAKPNP